MDEVMMDAASGFMVTDVSYNESITERWESERAWDGAVVGGRRDIESYDRCLKDAEVSYCHHIVGGRGYDQQEILRVWPPRIYRRVWSDGSHDDYRVDICWRHHPESRMEESYRNGCIVGFGKERPGWFEMYRGNEGIRRKRLRVQRARIPRYFPNRSEGEGGYDGREWACEIWPEEISSIRKNDAMTGTFDGLGMITTMMEAHVIEAPERVGYVEQKVY
jgi:hypothetical protein